MKTQTLLKRSLSLLSLALLSSALLPTQAQASDEILVWTDPVRLPGFQAYQKAHPSVNMRIVVTDTSQLPGKVDLFNKAGGGWPDVVFVGGPEQVAILSQKNVNYTADLIPLVSREILSNFATNALNQCRSGGKLYCLRNDLAQVVLWYNAKLMKDFGYTVPTTWEQYQALGLKVAKEHPGYVVGSFGDGQALNMFFAGSNCTVGQAISSTRVKIDLSSANCTRVTSLVDSLLSAGSLSKLGPFDADYIKLANDNKILMMPGASWYGEFVFKAAYKTPAGQIAAAMPLRWSSESTVRTGTQGGGAYFVSSHSKNLKAAADVVVWMSTSPDYQTDAPTQPAYSPAADLWGKKLATETFYASNPFAVLKTSATKINAQYSFVRFDTAGTFTNIVVAGVKSGKSVASLLNEYGNQLEQLAKTAGYTVSK